MAKIYQHTGIINEKEPDMLNAYPFRIEAVEFREGADNTDKTDELLLDLRKPVDNKLYYYGLVGGGILHNIHDEFMLDMGVEKREELVGKYVIGRINNGKSILQDMIISGD